MSEYLDARYHGLQNVKSREICIFTLNKQFPIWWAAPI